MRYYLAHDARATSADWLRVSVVDGASRQVIFSVNGAPSNRNASWARVTRSLDAYANRTIRLLIEANDGAADGLIEAAIDDVRVYAGSAASAGSAE